MGYFIKVKAVDQRQGPKWCPVGTEGQLDPDLANQWVKVCPNTKPLYA